MRQRRRSFLRTAGLAAGGALLPWPAMGRLRAQGAAGAGGTAVARRVPQPGGEGHRHHLGPRQRDVAGPLSPGNLRLRLRVHRLRRRRLDGPLPGQQRSVGLLHAGQADSQRALQEQPGRHLHRRHGTGRRARRDLRHGRRGRRLRQRRPRRHDRHRLRPADAVPQQRQRHLHRRHQGLRPRHPGLDDQRGVVRLRQRRQARSLPLQLRRVLGQGQRGVRRQQARSPLLLHPARVQADAEPAVQEQRQRHLHQDQHRHRHRARARQGARRGGDRFQRRRPDGPVRRQRHRPELPVRQSRRRASGRSSGSPPRSPSAPTASRGRAWASTPPISTRTGCRISSSPTSTRRCSRSTRTAAANRSPTSPTPTASPRRRGCCQAGA